MNRLVRFATLAAVPSDNNAAIAQAAAAVTTVIGVLTSLAVTGILAQAQRNHGVWLLAAFASVVAGAMLWLVVASLPLPAVAPPAGRWLPALRRSLQAFSARQRWVPAWARSLLEWPWHRVRWLPWTIVWVLRRWRWLLKKPVLQTLAVLATATGLMLAIFGMLLTQKDAERPTVSATFDRSTRLLTATAAAHGLSSDERLVVLVTGLVQKPKEIFREDTPSLYYAVIGPDSSGEVNHNAEVTVPATYKFVAVKAWTGARETKCETIPPRTGVPQRVLAGCLFLRLPPPG